MHPPCFCNNSIALLSVGTVEPLRCIFADCPPGSDRATRAYVLVVFLLFAILVLYYFHHRATLDHARATKHRQEMFAYLAAKRRLSGTTLATQRNGSERTDDIDDASSAPDNDEFEPSPRPPPLTIKFENLERVLPNGERVLSGVSGELKAGRLCAGSCMLWLAYSW